MEKIKKYISLSTLSFTLISCFMYVLAAAAGKREMIAPDYAFLLLVLSFVLGFSFAIFDIKALPRTAKRLLHIALTFGVTITGVLLKLKDSDADKAMIIFASCFAFLIVYFLCMLICAGLRKLENFIKDGKN